MSDRIQTQGHKLNDDWSFWYSPRGKKAKKTENYFENLTHLGDSTTIEDFFSYYCFFKRPTEAPVDNKILFFRKSCKPLWENWKDGGCWIIQFKRKDSEELLNRTWELLLLTCMGEELEDDFSEANVVGVVLSIRSKRNLLEIWLNNGHNEDKRVRIGEKLRTALSLDPTNLTFYFKDHAKSLQDKSTLKGAESYTFVSTPLETPLMTPTQIKEGGIPLPTLEI